VAHVDLFEPFTDKSIYQLILEGNLDAIHQIRTKLYQYVEAHAYDLIVGDALEGFNPTHDLCRYLINSIVKEYHQTRSRPIYNYAFHLDEAPYFASSSGQADQIQMDLDETEFDLKFKAAQDYPELKYEVDKALGLYGKEAFKKEIYFPVHDLNQIKVWSSPTPKYESYGRDRINNGTYREVIEFEKHMMPIASSILNL